MAPTNQVSTNLTDEVIPLHRLPRGAIGKIDDPLYPAFKDRVVLACYGPRYTALDTGDVWADGASVLVRRIPAGTKVTITAGS